MDLEAYRVEVQRTAPVHLPRDVRMLVAALGLCGEAGELMLACQSYEIDRIPAIKECGDVLWYCFELCEILGASFAELDVSSIYGVGIHAHSLQVSLSASRIGEHVKKHVGHGHELSAAIVEADLCSITSAIASMCSSSLRCTLGTVLDVNIAKLRARYPAGFTTAASVGRVDVEAMP